MKKQLLFLFFISSLFISCSDNHFRQFDILPEDQRWMAVDKKAYEFDIEDETQFYNIVFQFSHVYGYQFSEVPIRFLIQAPDGKTENVDVELMINEESEIQKSDCSGDICDIYRIIKKHTKLQKGKYKITVSHNFKRPYLPNVIGLGLNVENVK